MKHVTASEARKNWFRLLDEAAKGEVIAIQRNEKTLILKLEKTSRPTPDYAGIIDFENSDDADTWRWDWKPSRGLVQTKTRTKSKR